MLNEIIHGDCLEVMKRIPDESLDMILTSPPYYNAREYSKFSSYANYLSFIHSVMSLVFAKTKKAGILVLNLSCVIVPRISRNSESIRLPIPFDVCSMLSKNWTFIDDILWQKPDGASSRAIKFAHHRRPVAYKTFNVTEYVLVFSKPGALLDKSIRNHSEQQIADSLIKNDYERTNVWAICPERNQHPAPFPLSLAEKCVSYYSFVGDTILDPFIGSGTTAIACINTSRNYIGIEKEEKYWKIAEERAKAHRLTNAWRESGKPNSPNCEDATSPC